MRALRIFVVAAIAGASLANMNSARAQAAGPCASNPYLGGLTASGEDGIIGSGGPGAGGNASGILPLPDPPKLCATGSTRAIPPSHAVAAWFGSLPPTDQRKFLHEAARVGVVGHDGHPFGAGQFNEMAQSFDEAMTRQGMSDADKLKLLNMMAEAAGVSAADKAQTPQGRGG